MMKALALTFPSTGAGSRALEAQGELSAGCVTPTKHQSPSGAIDEDLLSRPEVQDFIALVNKVVCRTIVSVCLSLFVCAVGV